MSIYTTSMVIKIVEVVWFLTLGRTILIMLGGKYLFIKYRKGEKSAYFPFINLFTMLEIVNIDTFFGILLFIPFLNLIMMMVMSYKLGKKTEKGFIFRIGLIILPILFYPGLFLSIRKELKKANMFGLNKKNEDYPSMTEKNDNQSLSDFNENQNIEVENVDSIFKSNAQVMATTEKYKAAKIDEQTLNKISISDDISKDEDELFKPIEAISDEEVNRINENNASHVNQFIPQNSSEIIETPFNDGQTTSNEEIHENKFIPNNINESEDSSNVEYMDL